MPTPVCATADALSKSFDRTPFLTNAPTYTAGEMKGNVNTATTSARTQAEREVRRCIATATVKLAHATFKVADVDRFGEVLLVENLPRFDGGYQSSEELEKLGHGKSSYEENDTMNQGLPLVLKRMTSSPIACRCSSSALAGGKAVPIQSSGEIPSFVTKYRSPSDRRNPRRSK